MPKVTKKLGNNKARAWESLGFAHKKKLCQHFDTTSKFNSMIQVIIYIIQTVISSKVSSFAFNTLTLSSSFLFSRIITVALSILYPPPIITGK